MCCNPDSSTAVQGLRFEPKASYTNRILSIRLAVLEIPIHYQYSITDADTNIGNYRSCTLEEEEEEDSGGIHSHLDLLWLFSSRGRALRTNERRNTDVADG